jgi:nucleoside-diphosphate-sugar epimerase
MRVLVTGATGFLGRHLCLEMCRRGLPFVVFARSRERARFYLEHDVEVRLGDLSDVAACRAATKGVGAVLHLAAAADVSDPAVNQRINIDGLANLVGACRENEVKRFVFVSSTCAGRSRRDAYGETKLEGERIVRDSGLAFTILRPTMVYGRGSQEFEAFVRVIRLSPVVPLIGTGRNLVQPVFIGDAVRVLLDLVDADVTVGRTYDLAGGTSLSFDDLVGLVARTLGLRRRLLLHIPHRPVLLAARLLGALFTHVPLTVDQVLAFVQDTVVDLGPLRSDLGLTPLTLEEGLPLVLARRPRNDADASP